MPLNNFAWAAPEFCKEMEVFFENRAHDFSRGVPTISWDGYFGLSEKSTGYFIQCDMDFTDKCKAKLIDFPPAPDHMEIDFDSLSNFAKKAHTDSGKNRSEYMKMTKLTASFKPKRNYVIHSALANLYSSMGVTFSNISQVLSFYQEDFLKSWVLLNTMGRKEAALKKDETLKDFFKLMVNACYGTYYPLKTIAKLLFIS